MAFRLNCLSVQCRLRSIKQCFILILIIILIFITITIIILIIAPTPCYPPIPGTYSSNGCCCCPGPPGASGGGMPAAQRSRPSGVASSCSSQCRFRVMPNLTSWTYDWNLPTAAKWLHQDRFQAGSNVKCVCEQWSQDVRLILMKIVINWNKHSQSK